MKIDYNRDEFEVVNKIEMLHSKRVKTSVRIHYSLLNYK